MNKFSSIENSFPANLNGNNFTNRDKINSENE